MIHWLPLYTEDFLPVCVILLIICLLEWAIAHARGYKFNASHQVLKLAFAAYLLLLFQMTVSLSSLWVTLQSGTLTMKGNQMWEPFREIRNFWNYGSREEILVNLIGNVLAFVPMGVLPPLLWKWCRRPWGILPWVVIPSCFIEACQLFTPRSTSVDDVILNACGVLVGYLFFWLLRLCGVGKNTILKKK